MTGIKGLGLYSGPLAIIALMADPEGRPEVEHLTTSPEVAALGIVDGQDSDALNALEEDYAVRWATAFPADIVMVVEVLA